MQLRDQNSPRDVRSAKSLLRLVFRILRVWLAHTRTVGAVQFGDLSNEVHALCTTLGEVKHVETKVKV